MNKFKFYFILFSTLLVLFSSCNKDDDEVAATPLRDFGDQFKTDIENIELYLSTHKLNPDITDYAANVNSSNLLIKCSSTDLARLSLLGENTSPKLLSKLVNKHDITYKVYYLQFQEGNSVEKPCPYDEILVTYRGTSLKSETETQTSGQVKVVNETEFENSPVANLFNLGTVFVKGWPEIFPMFGIGVFDETATGNGPNVYTNYGAGIMFLPSGLAYYQQSPQTNIPSYSPLVFSFQLLNLKRSDNDNDGILTVDELAVNSEGKYTDTDGDGIYDFGDIDDDNDGFTTLNEIKKPTPLGINQGTSLYYPFNPIVDNPLTTDIDESEPKGIPDKSGDFSTPTRVRRHLDKNAKPPYTTY
ncbi:MAG: hypothetical protein O9267_06000 [Flavobacterium sp.]|uniref:FKBP-type peptidyl-prolyl cis-trans isomerase n=1 Tax=Flavobacterium sp. TaxID=239 RepID=UPI0022BC0231|nr:hypothetical protein [Flavobacterium sp.]MCZ8197137.1 hypothetical protein [Flavobacterium sp.]